MFLISNSVGSELKRSWDCFCLFEIGPRIFEIPQTRGATAFEGAANVVFRDVVAVRPRFTTAANAQTEFDTSTIPNVQVRVSGCAIKVPRPIFIALWPDSFNSGVFFRAPLAKSPRRSDGVLFRRYFVAFVTDRRKDVAFGLICERRFSGA